jgi:hypothetical protein
MLLPTRHILTGNGLAHGANDEPWAKTMRCDEHSFVGLLVPFIV